MDDQTEAALRLWVILSRTLRSIEAQLSRQTEARGLSLTEFAVLEVLLHKGRLPIGEIGERVLLSSGSMTYVVDKLEKRGLLGRRPCPDDRRVLHAALTSEGRALIEDVFDEHAGLIRDLMGDLTPAQLHETADRLKRVGLCARAANAEAAS